MKKDRCTCQPLSLIAGLVLVALGIYGVVGGFLQQWNLVDFWVTLVWYLGGVVLLTAGKMLKWSGCGSCKAHGRK